MTFVLVHDRDVGMTHCRLCLNDEEERLDTEMRKNDHESYYQHDRARRELRGAR